MRLLLLLLLGCGAPPVAAEPTTVEAAPIEAAKSDPRIAIDGAIDGDAVVFTIRLKAPASAVKVDVYGTDGLSLDSPAPDPTALAEGGTLTHRVAFAAPPPGASVVAHVQARFPDGDGIDVLSVRVGATPKPDGKATTVEGRPGRLKPAGP